MELSNSRAGELRVPVLLSLSEINTLIQLVMEYGEVNEETGRLYKALEQGAVEMDQLMEFLGKIPEEAS